MAALRDDADGFEIVGIVEYDAIIQQAMPLHRYAVEQRRDRWAAPSGHWFDESTIIQRIDLRREGGGRLRPHQHHFITDGKRHFLSTDQTADLGRRQIDSGTAKSSSA